MTVFKQITAYHAVELTDSIVISVGAEDEESITAAVSWAVDGDVEFGEGPLTVPQAMDMGRAKAAELGKDVVYVLLEPETIEWRPEWGSLQ